MHRRCSPETRYLRYFGTASQVPPSLLPVLLGTAPGTLALVAEAPDRRLIGLANLIRNHDGDTGEIALLVEDSWQRRGLGTALVRSLVTVAREHGLEALTAVTLLSNGGPTRVLARAGLCVVPRVVDGLLELHAPLPAGTAHATRRRLGDARPSWPGRGDEPRTMGDEARRETEQGSLGKLVVA
jgi:GNAT superfamily N-acetyltransferase